MSTRADVHTDALGAVRDDVRLVLRTAWIDPALEAASASPTFMSAAWSAVRPNVGGSFLLLSRALRSMAAESLRTSFDVKDLRKPLERHLSDEELKRVCESARAAHATAAKIQIVVHSMHRVSRRERIPGTGVEEPAVRRGIPEWQRWMSIQQVAEASSATLERASRRLGTPEPPASLRLFARWPRALSAVWAELGPAIGSQEWSAAEARLRRTTRSGVSSCFPHPVELQWAVLHERGFTEQERQEVMATLGAFERSAAAQTLVAAFLWLSFGSPEVGVES